VLSTFAATFWGGVQEESCPRLPRLYGDEQKPAGCAEQVAKSSRDGSPRRAKQNPSRWLGLKGDRWIAC
jgi:hypothetical protein